MKAKEKALAIFPRCDHGLVRGEGTACGALAFYRIGNCFFCEDHREQPRVRAYPIQRDVWFGNDASMNFGDLCAALGLPKPPPSDLDRLAKGYR